jgi:hypothetical protein
MPVVHEGATEVTYNKPNYCEENTLDAWGHADIMPYTG